MPPLCARTEDIYLRDDQLFANDDINLKEHLGRTEVALITKALDEAGWIVAHAASYLKMRRTTLLKKIRKFGLSRYERT